MIIISTAVGKKPLEKWSSHHSQQESLKCSTWMQSQKRKNFCLFPRQAIQYQNNPSLCPDQYAEEAELEWFYEEQDLLELTPKIDVLSL